MAMEVIQFIEKFNAFENADVLRRTFTQGFCYYFSLMLSERFPGGEIVYFPIPGHFVYLLNGVFYDITGRYLGQGKFYYWNSLEKFDSLWKNNIERGCILKID